MKIHPLTLAAVAASTLALAFVPAADKLVFAPAANAEAAKKLTIDTELSLNDASLTVNGEPVPGGGLDELESKTVLVNLAITATDKYVSTKDGRPVELHRTYDELEFEVEFGEESKSVDEVDELEGKTVRFAWNAKDEVYDKSFVGSEGDASQVAGLSDDMDLRVLLPEGPVKAGDTWEVEAKKLEPLFFPGGMTLPQGEGGEAGMEAVRQNITEQLSTFLKDFKVLCTYKGAREDGGVKVGEIAFTFEGKAKLELGSLLESALSQLGGEIPEMSVDGSASMSFSGDGTCLWSLDANHVHSFAMHSDVDFDMSMEVSGKQGDQPLEVSMSTSAGGKIDWRLAPAH